MNADEVLHRYGGDVLPYDESAGWEGVPCQAPCSEAIEDGHQVIRFEYAWNSAGYWRWLAREPETTPPPTLWVELGFRSNHPLGPYFTGCDGNFTIDYRQIVDRIYVYGDAAISHSGNDYVVGLHLQEFHTHRFESVDGTNYRFSVDGLVFHEGADQEGNSVHFLAFASLGGCLGDQLPNMVNEWDFVRYG